MEESLARAFVVSTFAGEEAKRDEVVRDIKDVARLLKKDWVRPWNH